MRPSGQGRSPSKRTRVNTLADGSRCWSEHVSEICHNPINMILRGVESLRTNLTPAVTTSKHHGRRSSIYKKRMCWVETARVPFHNVAAVYCVG